jgi:hypothetical protein
VAHLLMRLQALQAGDLETAYGRPQSTGSPSASDPSSGMKANRRPFDPDDTAEAGLNMPTAENIVVKLFALLGVLFMTAYVVVRMHDIIVNIHMKEQDGARTFYRLLIVMVEMAYGMSSCTSIVSRSRRQRLEAITRNRKDTPFTADDIITLLYVTDETAETIEESVRSHYAASKPDLPFRVVLVADSPGGPAEDVAKSLSRENGSLLHFVKEDLARQEYVMNVANEELQAALNLVLEENMYLGQVLFYCLDRLFLQYGHSISNGAIVVMPASSVVDAEVRAVCAQWRTRSECARRTQGRARLLSAVAACRTTTHGRYLTCSSRALRACPRRRARATRRQRRTSSTSATSRARACTSPASAAMASLRSTRRHSWRAATACGACSAGSRWRTSTRSTSAGSLTSCTSRLGRPRSPRAPPTRPSPLCSRPRTPPPSSRRCALLRRVASCACALRPDAACVHICSL